MRVESLFVVLSLLAIPGAVSAQMQSTGREAATGYHWEHVSLGDCTGGDIQCSTGFQPVTDLCDQSTLGLIAVCWGNGDNIGFPPFKGCSARPAEWCTYKQATPQQCNGGGNPGNMYVCLKDR